MTDVVDEAWISYVEAAVMAGRSTTWISQQAAAGVIGYRIADDGSRRRYVLRSDVEQLARRVSAKRERDLQRAVPPAPPGMVAIADAARSLRCTRRHVFLLGQREELTIRSEARGSYVAISEVERLQRLFFGELGPREVVSYTEAADLLGLSVEQVRRRVRWGVLTPVGRSRHRLLSRAEVLELRSAPVRRSAARTRPRPRAG